MEHTGRLIEPEPASLTVSLYARQRVPVDAAVLLVGVGLIAALR